MQASGSVQVQAVTSQAQIPVEGATVTISTVGADGARTLLSLQRTDESGLTRSVSIDTPPAENSLSPDQARGWTSLRIAVSHPNYNSVIVNTVQVFPGVTTLQEMTLVPRGGLPEDPAGTEEFTIPDQGL